MNGAKRSSRKTAEHKVAAGGPWVIKRGRQVSGRGRPDGVESLCTAVAEKIPFVFFDDVRKDANGQGLNLDGIYMAHDSMGHVRYVGRGDIFNRLKARYKAEPLALAYFSFYVIRNKKHEREVETLLIRAASPLLEFNARKKRTSIEVGNVLDYEAGTMFYERQAKRGRKTER